MGLNTDIDFSLRAVTLELWDIDASTGLLTPAWARHLQDDARHFAPDLGLDDTPVSVWACTMDADQVYVSTFTQVSAVTKALTAAYNRSTGDLVWAKIHTEVSNTLAIKLISDGDGTLVMQFADGRICALDSSDGSLIWSRVENSAASCFLYDDHVTVIWTTFGGTTTKRFRTIDLAAGATGLNLSTSGSFGIRNSVSQDDATGKIYGPYLGTNTDFYGNPFIPGGMTSSGDVQWGVVDATGAAITAEAFYWDFTGTALASVTPSYGGANAIQTASRQAISMNKSGPLYYIVDSARTSGVPTVTAFPAPVRWMAIDGDDRIWAAQNSTPIITTRNSAFYGIDAGAFFAQYAIAANGINVGNAGLGAKSIQGFYEGDQLLTCGEYTQVDGPLPHVHGLPS